MNFHPVKARDRHFGIILLRALCSTVAIGVLASAVTVWLHGRFQFEEIMGVWREFWPLLAIIFLALSIWDYWLQRTAPSRHPNIK
jgi:sterol desaturase/sphingolipid hydroxylase (fatty acid hydroxylase superfamily)